MEGHLVNGDNSPVLNDSQDAEVNMSSTSTPESTNQELETYPNPANLTYSFSNSDYNSLNATRTIETRPQAIINCVESQTTATECRMNESADDSDQLQSTSCPGDPVTESAEQTSSEQLNRSLEVNDSMSMSIENKTEYEFTSSTSISHSTPVSANERTESKVTAKGLNKAPVKCRKSSLLQVKSGNSDKRQSLPAISKPSKLAKPRESLLPPPPATST